MLTDKHTIKSFSFDGDKINFYLANSSGDLRPADNGFEDFKAPQLCERREGAAVEDANVADIAFQIFFEGLEIENQELIKQKLSKSSLGNFRKENQNGLERFYMDLVVGSNKIRAGMIVAFGGFFGIPDEPIACDLTSTSTEPLSSAELEKRFLSAFQTLKLASGREVEAIVKQIGWEGDTIHGLIKRKVQPSIIMGAAKGGKVTWANLTSRSLGWKKHIPGGFFIGRYVQSATMNFDHFGLEAERAYEAGHHLALKLAEDASKLSDEDNVKWEKFVEALGVELFACHFFADLFVSGHVRTPRRKVFEVLNKGYAIKQKWIAALFANQMHDEDNEKGVYVCSENHPNPWEAMGDYRYSDDGSSGEGERYVQIAIAARLNELYQVFRGKVDHKSVASCFKKDIPHEATPEWLEHCKSDDLEAQTRAIEHARKFPPLLRVGANGTLGIRPTYQAIEKKEIMLLLADMLANGVTGKVKEISDNAVTGISRITPLLVKNSCSAISSCSANKVNTPDCSIINDPLKRKILEELLILDSADEIIVGIELPEQDTCKMHWATSGTFV